MTVLFSDLVGSTALLHSLGEDKFGRVRRRHLDTLRAAVAAQDGSVVKTTGDGIMAVFASASRAVECAVGMQQATTARAQDGSAGPLSIRIGVSVGDATGDDEGDWYGAPVVEAARLCDAADGDCILVSASVRSMVGPRGREFVDAGERVLKGIPDVVQVFEVPWPRRSTRLPLPPTLQAAGSGALFGRAEECERISDVLKQVWAGECRTVLVGGEPGIGKTRLAAWLAVRAFADGAVVLHGRCDEQVRAVFATLGEAFAPLAQGDGVSETPLAELATMFSGPGAGIRGIQDARADPEAERLRLFGAAVHALEAGAVETPVVLVLDDLHWADRLTLQFVRHLVRTPPQGPVLLVGTYRHTDVDGTGPFTEFAADLRREAGVVRIGLDGLDQAAVAAIVETVTGATVATDRLHEDTAGNPFFVREVLADIEESAQRREGASLARWDGAAPSGVVETVRRRAARLPGAAAAVLGAASVAGHEFDLAVLERVVPEHGDVLAVLEAAAAAGLVAESADSVGRFGFVHAIVRNAFSSEMSAARRARLHGRIAEAIEEVHSRDLGAYVETLAHHFGEAAPFGYGRKAAWYALGAAWQALQGTAIEEATTILETALEALDRDGTVDHRLRCELMLELAWARYASLGIEGRRSAALEAAAEARKAGSPVLLARAALMFDYPTLGVRDVEALSLIEEALDAIGSELPGLRVQLLAVLAVLTGMAGETEAGRVTSLEAVRLAEALPDPLASTEAWQTGPPLELAVFARVILSTPASDPAEPIELAGRLVRPEPTEGPGGYWLQHKFVTSTGLRLRARLRLASGDRAGFEADVSSYAGLFEGTGYPHWAAQLAQWQALVDLLDGRFEQAQQNAQRALDLSGGHTNFFMGYAVQSCWRQHEIGSLGDVVDMMSAAAAANPGVPALQALAGLAALHADRTDQARAVLDSFAGEDFAALPRDVAWPAAIAALADVAATLGDTASVAALYRLLHPFAGQLVVAGEGTHVQGAVDRFLGMLATDLDRHDAATGHFRSAVELEEKVRSRPLLARTRYWAARLHSRQGGPGDAARASELLETCLADAADLGMRRLQREAEALAAQL